MTTYAAKYRPGIISLRWLLLSLMLVMALHVAHLPLWVSALIAGFGVWRYLIERNAWQLPRLWLLLPLTLLAALAILITFKGLFGRDASVALLALMLSLKLMEAQYRRDFILLVYSGYFLTITVFLFDQSITTGLLMLLPVVGLTATLVGVNHPNGELGWRNQSRIAGSLLLQALPLMVVLFLLFPRIPGPLWGVPQDSYRAMSGLSDSMSPGNISELTLSGATAFRVQFEGDVPANNQLYWRGPVLWHYDGRRWIMSSPNLNIARESLQLSGKPTRYTLTLEPHNRQWLLMLDMPTALPAADAFLSRDRQVLSAKPVRTRLRYSGESHLDYLLAETISERERTLALQIPDAENPRTVALARQWAETSRSHAGIVQQALSMFRQQAFVYTLSPPKLGNDAMDDFLFNSRRGFCEHYASSFVYLMRAAGVPARIVTGYQGGELNPVGNYLIVRQSDAHAWAEVWLAGRGWVRIDPTAAVSPSRIESGIAGALPETDELPLLSRRDHPWLSSLYLNLDAMNNGWNQWVLGYNQQRQMELLSRLTGNKVSWQDLTVALIASAALVLLVISCWLLRGLPLKTLALQRLYLRFLRKLARAGLQRKPHEGPMDFSLRAARHMPASARQIEQISRLYADLRYSRTPDSNGLQRLKHLISTLRIS